MEADVGLIVIHYINPAYKNGCGNRKGILYKKDKKEAKEPEAGNLSRIERQTIWQT